MEVDRSSYGAELGTHARLTSTSFPHWIQRNNEVELVASLGNFPDQRRIQHRQPLSASPIMPGKPQQSQIQTPVLQVVHDAETDTAASALIFNVDPSNQLHKRLRCARISTKSLTIHFPMTSKTPAFLKMILPLNIPVLACAIQTANPMRW